ncbi:uncharacterized protein [Pocillopora verrucosa]|uniref:uncharacterized protein isoform X1 n=1 Tax=Pocillopora verrucosa TaxID=203993 RepID=UPI00334139B2
MARMRTAEILLFLRVSFLAVSGSYGTTISASSEVSSTVPGIQSTPSSLLDGSTSTDVPSPILISASETMPYIQSTPSIILESSTSAVVPTQSLISDVSGSNSSLHLGNSSMTSTNMTKSLQDKLTTAVVVESSSTPLTTFYTISASPRGSGASTMFTEQPSSTYVFASSPAIYSSMKLPESSPEPNSTQIYNLNASTVEPPTTANTTKPSTTGGTEEPDAKSWMWIIIGASVGGVVVFMIVVIIVCRCLKRKRKNRNVVLPNDADADDKPGGNVAMESYNQSEERPKLAPSQ